MYTVAMAQYGRGSSSARPMYSAIIAAAKVLTEKSQSRTEG